MTSGWISIHRQIEKKGYYKKSEYVHLWIHLLLKANHKDNFMFLNGKETPIKSGSFITSRAKLALETGLEPSKVERILKCFKSEQQIEQQSFNKYRLISITNYKKYQNVKQQSEQQVNSKRTASEQQVNTDNKDNNDNKDNKKELQAKKSPAKTTNPDIKIFIDGFFEKFKSVTGEKYLCQGGKDGATVKRLLQTYKLDELNILRDKFFNSTDEFVLKAGFSIGVFSSVINKLLSADNSKDKKKLAGQRWIEKEE